MLSNALYDALNDYAVNAGVSDVQKFINDAEEILGKLVGEVNA